MKGQTTQCFFNKIHVVISKRSSPLSVPTPMHSFTHTTTWVAHVFAYYSLQKLQNKVLPLLVNLIAEERASLLEN